MFRKTNIFKALSFMVAVCVATSAVAAEVRLPEPGTMVKLSEAYERPFIRGVNFDQSNPFNLEFIIDQGTDKKVSMEERAKLVRYFLAALTIPEEKMWVNLSPYESGRIIDDKVLETEIGETLLSQDYMLKQLASSLTHPDTELGQDYWTQSLQDDLSKIWIKPETISVYDNDKTVFITDVELMVESENSTQGVLTSTIKEEINSGKNFAELRQMVYSIILAQWFKKKFAKSLYSFYFDTEKTTGVDVGDASVKEQVFERYVEAFNKGAYNLTKKERNQTTNRLQKRRYFSGGLAIQSSAIAKQVSSSGIDQKQEYLNQRIKAITETSSSVTSYEEQKKELEELVKKYSNLLVKSDDSDKSFDVSFTDVVDGVVIKEVIKDLSRIVFIKKLDFSNTGVTDSDMSNLAGLKNLQVLSLWNTQVSDLSLLVAFVNLQVLSLWGLPVSDISVLADIVSLQELYLNETQVSDLSALVSLVNLRRLSLGDTLVSDISSIANLEKLQKLSLAKTKVKDVSVLANLMYLQELNLNGTQVPDDSAYELLALHPKRDKLILYSKNDSQLKVTDKDYQNVVNQLVSNGKIKIDSNGVIRKNKAGENNYAVGNESGKVSSSATTEVARQGNIDLKNMQDGVEASGSSSSVEFGRNHRAVVGAGELIDAIQSVHAIFGFQDDGQKIAKIIEGVFRTGNPKEDVRISKYIKLSFSREDGATVKVVLNNDTPFTGGTKSYYIHESGKVSSSSLNESNGGIDLKDMLSEVEVSQSSSAIVLTAQQQANITGLTFRFVDGGQVLPLNQIIKFPQVNIK